MKSIETATKGPEHLLIPEKEASQWLGIPAFTLYSWAQSQRIPHYKIGKRVLFSKDGLKGWIDAQHETSVRS